MSNHLAIATVTAVLRKTLQDALDAAQPAVTGAIATTVRPNAPQADLPNPGVNLFLYQTTPSEALRNLDLPRRRADMSIAQRPQAALDLHYLITFHGADPRLEPQIMHGIVTRALHERPVVTRAAIEATLADPVFEFLAGSDLADAIELARISPVALSVEEMGKLWSIFYQIPYVLSVAYRASVVLIESELSAREAPPVRVSRVRSQPSTGPRIAQVVAASEPHAQILAGQDIVLRGEHLRAAVTRVRFGAVEAIPDGAAMTDDRIRLALPSSLLAGVHGAQVVHQRTAEASTVEAASNLAAFVLHPTVAATQAGSDLHLSLVPAVGRSQRVAVLLHETPTPVGRAPRDYMLRVPGRPATAPETSTTLDVALADVAPGDYLVRVQVDGAESPLTYDDASGAYTAPKVTIA